MALLQLLLTAHCQRRRLHRQPSTAPEAKARPGLIRRRRKGRRGARGQPAAARHAAVGERDSGHRLLEEPRRAHPERRRERRERCHLHGLRHIPRHGALCAGAVAAPPPAKAKAASGGGGGGDDEDGSTIAADAATASSLRNTALRFVGLSMLLPASPPDEDGAASGSAGELDRGGAAVGLEDPLARFLAQRATKSYDMAGPGGLFRVRSVASAPGDPFARFVLRTASKERLVETAVFYCDVLRMSEVGMPSDEEKCFRYKPVPGGALVGVPTTLVPGSGWRG